MKCLDISVHKVEPNGIMVWWKKVENAAGYRVELRIGTDESDTFVIAEQSLDRNTCYCSFVNLGNINAGYYTENGVKKQYYHRPRYENHMPGCNSYEQEVYNYFYVKVIAEDRQEKPIQESIILKP